MKGKNLFLALIPILLVGCSSNKEKTLVLDAGFIFDFVQNQEGEYLASLYYNESGYYFSSNIELDKPLVAGDQLSITFKGDYSVACAETYPASCKVKGNIKSYSLIETQIYGIHVDDATIGVIANHIKSDYILDNEYVILDEEGRFTSLDDYDGQDLYLSCNKRKMDENCSCPDGAQCDVCPLYIAGLYAYDPRSVA